jgi:hypothetical protein
LLDALGYAVGVFDDRTGMPSLDPSLPLSTNILAVPREAISRLVDTRVIHGTALAVSPRR